MLTVAASPLSCVDGAELKEDGREVGAAAVLARVGVILGTETERAAESARVDSRGWLVSYRIRHMRVVPGIGEIGGSRTIIR